VELGDLVTLWQEKMATKTKVTKVLQHCAMGRKDLRKGREVKISEAKSAQAGSKNMIEIRE
jgi:hypothetical protein